jgi:hypothetical protein
VLHRRGFLPAGTGSVKQEKEEARGKSSRAALARDCVRSENIANLKGGHAGLHAG